MFFRLHKDFDVFKRDNNSELSMNAESGYSTDIVKFFNKYPRHAIPKVRNGLGIKLHLLKKDMDYNCQGPVQGFKIFWHPADELPRASHPNFVVPLKRVAMIQMKPHMTTTSDNLIDYSPERRQCYFDGEKYLQYFKIYTQSNCELECVTNFTLNYCNCAKFSMPRDNDTVICSHHDIKCYTKAEDLWLFSESTNGIATNRGKMLCNCLPSCTTVKYNAEINLLNADLEEHSGYNLYLSKKQSISS